jgi:hypothetical protein
MIKFKEILEEEISFENIKYLYHATYLPLLKKIKQYGLNTNKEFAKQIYEDSIPGIVYLAFDKDVAASYAETSDIVPENWLEKIIILSIDINKLDKSKLFKDRNVQSESTDTLEYRGVIPFNAIVNVERYF